ncbi:hypothetical protein HOO54_07050 [Bacillus sp. WMMC1349]|uniref:hypothetical protein n=1 Tax=Bacillus sp. WMMC1349 TaxID=2736254 RepID=UPI0015547706|nr:hypothetical protein [Bacillus sp. WMMC1349]NPC91975.1 hypothetical protein [Bacillus sp. WMMC1349]
MKVFSGLLKKDIVISRFWSIIWLILTILIMIGSSLIAYYEHEPLFMFGLLVFLLLCQSFYSPSIMLSQLRLEGKTQIWLYNPNNSFVLLLSKLAAAAVYQLIAQLIILIFGIIVRNQLVTISIGLYSMWDLLLMNGLVFFWGMLLSMWVMLMWTVYQVLGKYSVLKKVRWLIVCVLFYSYSLIEYYALGNRFIKQVWDLWNIPVKADFDFEYHEASGWSVTFSQVNLPGNMLIYYAVLAVCLFYFSGKLLAKKVEV